MTDPMDILNLPRSELRVDKAVRRLLRAGIDGLKEQRIGQAFDENVAAAVYEKGLPGGPLMRHARLRAEARTAAAAAASAATGPPQDHEHKRLLGSMAGTGPWKPMGMAEYELVAAGLAHVGVTLPPGASPGQLAMLVYLQVVASAGDLSAGAAESSLELRALEDEWSSEFTKGNLAGAHALAGRIRHVRAQAVKTGMQAAGDVQVFTDLCRAIAVAEKHNLGAGSHLQRDAQASKQRHDSTNAETTAGSAGDAARVSAIAAQVDAVARLVHEHDTGTHKTTMGSGGASAAGALVDGKDSAGLGTAVLQLQLSLQALRKPLAQGEVNGLEACELREGPVAEGGRAVGEWPHSEIMMYSDFFLRVGLYFATPRAWAESEEAALRILGHAPPGSAGLPAGLWAVMVRSCECSAMATKFWALSPAEWADWLVRLRRAPAGGSDAAVQQQAQHYPSGAGAPNSCWMAAHEIARGMGAPAPSGSKAAGSGTALDVPKNLQTKVSKLCSNERNRMASKRQGDSTARAAVIRSLLSWDGWALYKSVNLYRKLWYLLASGAPAPAALTVRMAATAWDAEGAVCLMAAVEALQAAAPRAVLHNLKPGELALLAGQLCRLWSLRTELWPLEDSKTASDVKKRACIVKRRLLAAAAALRAAVTLCGTGLSRGPCSQCRRGRVGQGQLCAEPVWAAGSAQREAIHAAAASLTELQLAAAAEKAAAAVWCAWGTCPLLLLVWRELLRCMELLLWGACAPSPAPSAAQLRATKVRDEALEQQQARAAVCRDDPVSPAALSELQDRGMGEGAVGDLRLECWRQRVVLDCTAAAGIVLAAGPGGLPASAILPIGGGRLLGDADWGSFYEASGKTAWGVSVGHDGGLTADCPLGYCGGSPLPGNFANTPGAGGASAELAVAGSSAMLVVTCALAPGQLVTALYT